MGIQQTTKTLSDIGAFIGAVIGGVAGASAAGLLGAIFGAIIGGVLGGFVGKISFLAVPGALIGGAIAQGPGAILGAIIGAYLALQLSSSNSGAPQSSNQAGWGPAAGGGLRSQPRANAAASPRVGAGLPHPAVAGALSHTVSGQTGGRTAAAVVVRPQVPTTDIVGKICPYCLSPIVRSNTPTVVLCPQCGIAHHADCWRENGGCTTYGCLASPGVAR